MKNIFTRSDVIEILKKAMSNKGEFIYNKPLYEMTPDDWEFMLSRLSDGTELKTENILKPDIHWDFDDLVHIEQSLNKLKNQSNGQEAMANVDIPFINQPGFKGSMDGFVGDMLKSRDEFLETKKSKGVINGHLWVENGHITTDLKSDYCIDDKGNEFFGKEATKKIKETESMDVTNPPKISEDTKTNLFTIEKTLSDLREDILQMIKEVYSDDAHKDAFEEVGLAWVEERFTKARKELLSTVNSPKAIGIDFETGKVMTLTDLDVNPCGERDIIESNEDMIEGITTNESEKVTGAALVNELAETINDMIEYLEDDCPFNVEEWVSDYSTKIRDLLNNIQAELSNKPDKLPQDKAEIKMLEVIKNSFNKLHYRRIYSTITEEDIESAKRNIVNTFIVFANSIK